MKKLKYLLFILLFIPSKIYAYDKAVVDINNLSIKELQEYVDKGYLTYEKITKLYLDRIEAYNEKYNAIITINENALEEARQKDIEYKKNGRTSLIYGLPLMVKDNIDVKGMPTTNGTKALLDSYPNEDADVVKKLRENGAIFLGKTNMDEFAFNYMYSHSSFGYTTNAYNTLYTSYGSSGGSAVSVAANLVVYALGSDTGVSVRVPSSANGVVGIRPSFDIMSGKGVIKFESTRDVVGVITKYVEDSAIVLDIIDNEETKYTDYLNDNLKGIKIGVVRSYVSTTTSNTSTTYGKVDKSVYELFNQSINKLKELGAEVVYIDSLPLSYKFDATNMCYEFNQYIKNTSSKIKSLDDLIKDGRYTQWIDSYNNYWCNIDYTKTSSYKSYINHRNSNIKKAENVFNNNKLDAIIYPTIKNELLTLQSAKNGYRTYTPSSMTAPLTGYPALTLPMGKIKEFSYGLEIFTKSKNEPVIYKIASSFEKVNKVYKTPDISPSLYEIPSDVTKLLNYYDEYKNNSNYELANKRMQEFIDTYDENKIKIRDLLIKYEYPYIKNKESKNRIIYIIPIVIIILFIPILKKKKHKRKRTR